MDQLRETNQGEDQKRMNWEDYTDWALVIVVITTLILAMWK